MCTRVHKCTHTHTHTHTHRQAQPHTHTHTHTHTKTGKHEHTDERMHSRMHARAHSPHSIFTPPPISLPTLASLSSLIRFSCFVQQQMFEFKHGTYLFRDYCLGDIHCRTVFTNHFSVNVSWGRAESIASGKKC